MVDSTNMAIAFSTTSYMLIAPCLATKDQNLAKGRFICYGRGMSGEGGREGRREQLLIFVSVGVTKYFSFPRTLKQKQKQPHPL